MVSSRGWPVQERKAWWCLRLGEKLSYCSQLPIFWDKYLCYVMFSLHYFIWYMCNDGLLVVLVFMYWILGSSWRKDEYHIIWNWVSLLVTFFLFFFLLTKNCNFGSIVLRGAQPYDLVHLCVVRLIPLHPKQCFQWTTPFVSLKKLSIWPRYVCFGLTTFRWQDERTCHFIVNKFVAWLILVADMRIIYVLYM